MSDARHEMEGMTAVPDTAEPWATRLGGPHPPAVSRAVGALLTCTLSRTQALMVAYTLADAGLLAEPADTDEVAEPEVTYTAGLPHIAGIEEYVRADPGWRVNDPSSSTGESLSDADGAVRAANRRRLEELARDLESVPDPALKMRVAELVAHREQCCAGEYVGYIDWNLADLRWVLARRAESAGSIPQGDGTDEGGDDG